MVSNIQSDNDQNKTFETMFQLNWMEIAEKIDDLFLGDAEVCLNCVTKLMHTYIS